MPIIEFHLLEGRTTEQKRALSRAVATTVAEVLGIKKETVRILIHDIGAENFSVAGVTAGEKKENVTASRANVDPGQPFGE